MTATGKFRNPVIEGGRATFVWRGRAAPRLTGDFNDWDPKRTLKLKKSASGVWERTLELPADAYVEYAFVQGGEHKADPNNPRRVFNGMDAYNHYFYMPEGRPTALVRRRPGVKAGQVSAHMISAHYCMASGQQMKLYDRMVYLYRPPVEAPCPLLVVYDGEDYLRMGRLAVLVDNLIAQGRIRPVAMAMAAHGGEARSLEYACSDLTVGFVRDNVLPLAQEKLNLVDLDLEPGAFGVLGASMGGLMALYTAIRLPQVFGRALSQSGALDEGFVLHELVRLGDSQPVRIWLDVGIYESLLADNRQMHALLRDKGYDVAYREHSGGHNYTSWRNDVWRGLEALFPRAG